MALSRMYSGMLLLVLASGLFSGQAHEAVTLFRIGSAGEGGIYFPIANAIATAISGAGECGEEQDCGAAHLLAVAQVSNGSVANVRDLENASLEAGLVQADVAYAAYHGRDAFAGEQPYTGLRALANLYPECLHLIVPAESPIHSVSDLRGRRVSLDEPGSGTLASARLILAAYGLDEDDLQAVYLKQQPAADALQENRLDAFFLVAGYPAAAVAELAAARRIRLIPLDDARARALIRKRPYFSLTRVPADAYRRVPATPTLQVGAQLLADARLDEELAYRVTRALWSERTRRALEAAHARGREIRPQQALEGIAVPLHPGAARYYREAGLLPENPP